MATKGKQDHYDDDDDDIISRCGSVSGETFSSHRSRRGVCSLRQHRVDQVAKKLRELPIEKEQTSSSCNDLDHKNGCKLSQGELAKRPRFNTCFHNFRFLVAMFGGFSVGVMMLLRYNITISILKMVNQTHLYLEEHPGSTLEDMIANGHTPGGEFNWNNEVQHMIMSWYMVAYTLPQMPATKLGTMIGTRLAIPISLITCSMSTILVPYCAYLGWQYVIVLRLFNGLGASAVFPLLITLVENWMRSDEISLGLSVAQCLVTILAATNPLIAGYLSSIHWSYSFYVPGVCTLVFCALWFVLITDNPIDNYFVSEKEINYICECEAIEQKQSTKVASVDKKTGDKQIQDGRSDGDDGLDYKPDSWLQVLRVPSFYAYMIMWCGYCSAYSGFSFVLPTYLRQFLKIPIAQNGFYCFIVQSGALLAVVWPYPLLRLLEHKFGLSTQTSRRIAHLLCCSMVAATWIYVGSFHESQLLLLFLNRCFHNGNDIIVTGCLMSNYAKAGLSGLVFSMVNTVGNLSVVFSSTFMGWLLDYTAQSRQGWQMIFSGLGVSQLIMWLLFATIVPSGPIKFKNKRRVPDCEAQSQPKLATKSNDIPILNNFDKLRGTSGPQESCDEKQNDEKPRESRQI